MNRVLMVGKHISRYSTALHTHKNYKLIYCNAGGGRVQFERDAYMYKQVDLVVIEPNVYHVNVPNEDFVGTYVTLDQVPFKVDRILQVHDTESQALAQCVYQINGCNQVEFFNKDSVLQSYGALLCNLIVSLASLRKISPVVEHLRDAIRDRFSDASFDINQLFVAQHDYNENYLKKLFKKEVGISPQQYLINIRLTHAVKLLTTHDREQALSVTKIAYACGYDDPLYFSRSFKTRYGISPKAFYQDSLC